METVFSSQKGAEKDIPVTTTIFTNLDWNSQKTQLELSVDGYTKPLDNPPLNHGRMIQAVLKIDGQKLLILGKQFGKDFRCEYTRK